MANRDQYSLRRSLLPNDRSISTVRAAYARTVRPSVQSTGNDWHVSQSGRSASDDMTFAWGA